MATRMWPLQLLQQLGLETPSVHPWTHVTGKADEVSGKGLRKIKIVLAPEWKCKPCQGYFQKIFPLAGHSRELSHNNSIPENMAIATRADRRSSPWGPGSQGRRGLGSTTKLTSWLRDRLYPQTPAPSLPSHPDSLTLGGELCVCGVTNSPSSPLSSHWLPPPPSGQGPPSPWRGS